MTASRPGIQSIAISARVVRRSLPLAYLIGAGIGIFRMLGPGGAEFRPPPLVGAYGFLTLQAFILNKAVSLIIVFAALPARLIFVLAADLAPVAIVVRDAAPTWGDHNA
ncbi:MAG: hypothetical protein ABJD68_13465 [Nakamurella sp.]